MAVNQTQHNDKQSTTPQFSKPSPSIKFCCAWGRHLGNSTPNHFRGSFTTSSPSSSLVPSPSSTVTFGTSSTPAALVPFPALFRSCVSFAGVSETFPPPRTMGVLYNVSDGSDCSLSLGPVATRTCGVITQSYCSWLTDVPPIE